MQDGTPRKTVRRKTASTKTTKTVQDTMTNAQEQPQASEQSAAHTSHAEAPHASPHDRVIDALLRLLDTTDWNAITLGAIAAEAAMNLPDLRGLFPSKGAIMAAFARRIDVQTLKQEPLAGQPLPVMDAERDKLARILKTRFHLLNPYKQALVRFRSSLMTDPSGAWAWNKVLLNSAQWMLAGAGYEETGLRGHARAQGLVLLLLKVMPVWQNDATSLEKTNTAIDEELARALRWQDGVTSMIGNLPFFRNFSGSSSTAP